MGAWPKGIVLLLVAITRVQAAFYARSCMIKAFQTDGKLQDKRVFSQMGEDGIIEAMHRCIDREFNGTYVEFGTESCRECTSRHLREKKGWKGLLMDGGYQDESINLHKEMIAYDNIVSLFQKYKVPMQFDLLTIDLDLNSYWPAQQILSAGYRPRTLVIEFNRNFDEPISQSYIALNLPSSQQFFPTSWGLWGEPYKERIDGSRAMHCYFGASPRALTRLMQHFGYLPVVFDAAGINIFFVHNEEVGGLRKPSRPSKVPGDTIDDDFNLENTIRSLEKAIALLGTSSIFGFMLGRTLHAPCHLHTWYKASPGINYSNIEWMRELELVVLSMGENDVGRVFREERIITGAMTGASNEKCPVRFSQP